MIGANVYANKSKIVLTNIGRVGDDSPAQACFTGETRPSDAEWFFPNGTVVPTELSSDTSSNGFERVTQPVAIILHHKSSTLSPTGIYCCVVPFGNIETKLCTDLGGYTL